MRNPGAPQKNFAELFLPRNRHTAAGLPAAPKEVLSRMYQPVADCHLHTDFSPDSKTPAEETIRRAIELGLTHIAITDHFDPKHPEDFVGIADAAQYARTLSALKKKYEKDIYVSVGVEIGYMPFTEEAAAAFFDDPAIEYIINSVHVVSGYDCYNPAFYEGKTRDEAYGEYFAAVYDSVRAPYRFDAVGHIGYVERRAPYADRRIRYADFKEILDKIFDVIIERDKILELNTSTSIPDLVCIPTPELAEAYFKRGGRRITFSSDAHDTARIADNFAAAALVARDIGFTCITVKENGAYRDINI